MEDAVFAIFALIRTDTIILAMVVAITSIITVSMVIVIASIANALAAFLTGSLDGQNMQIHPFMAAE